MPTSASSSQTWEDTFQSWGKPPGTTEQEKCDNSVRAVKKAIDARRVAKRIAEFALGKTRSTKV